MLLAPDDWLAIAARLSVAVAFGAVIGLERERKERGAGLRTNMIVALGAAVFTVAGLMMTEAASEIEAVRIDPSRMIAGLIGGVGFLGAGVIIQSQGQVRGMTTAASIWVCAAIGMAAGAGFYQLATLAAAFGLVILVVVRLFEQVLGTKS